MKIKTVDFKKFDHIDTDTILIDIRDTKQEIENYNVEIIKLNKKITEREEFITELKNILKYRDKK
jgi:peptidoglycan hydrolase CwlO-like protein